MIITAIINFIYWILQIYLYIMFFGILLTWIPNAYNVKLFRMIRNTSEWYLGLFSNIISFGSIDFSPFIAIGIYYYILDMLSGWIPIL